MKLEKKAFRSLKRAYDLLHIEFFQIFKSVDVTAGQFDLMETVSLSKDKALSIQGITNQTICQQPNVTRMISDLVKMGMVQRKNINTDQRMVIVQLTEKGLKTVKNIQKALFKLHIEQFNHFSKDELRLFTKLLNKVK